LFDKSKKVGVEGWEGKRKMSNGVERERKVEIRIYSPPPIRCALDRASFVLPKKQPRKYLPEHQPAFTQEFE